MTSSSNRFFYSSPQWGAVPAVDRKAMEAAFQNEADFWYVLLHISFYAFLSTYSEIFKCSMKYIVLHD